MSEHRLIYADELLEVFEQYLNNISYEEESISKSARLSLIKWVIDKTNEQSTAYDIDAVVEQLEKERSIAFVTLANTGNKEYDAIYTNVVAYLDKAIEIVKGGSNEMNRNITYCINNDCPFKDCERHMAQIPTKEGVYTLANFDGVCKRYIKFVASEVAK